MTVLPIPPILMRYDLLFNAYLNKKKERPTFLAILELAFDVDRIGRASQPTRYQYDDLVLLFVLNARGYKRLAILFSFCTAGIFRQLQIFLYPHFIYSLLSRRVYLNKITLYIKTVLFEVLSY
ncbi:hypothetical protein QYZ44_17275 [Vibrio parahaemolyticus]|nr:hypothetical protein [Vibrio parahaemolyticus]MDN4710964.1 hypothetical protein [Vibrio parahaemolyticus]